MQEAFFPPRDMFFLSLHSTSSKPHSSPHARGFLPSARHVFLVLALHVFQTTFLPPCKRLSSLRATCFSCPCTPRLPNHIPPPMQEAFFPPRDMFFLSLHSTSSKPHSSPHARGFL